MNITSFFNKLFNNNHKSSNNYNYNIINRNYDFDSIDEIEEKLSISFYYISDINHYKNYILNIFNGEFDLTDDDINYFDDVNILNILASYHKIITKNYNKMIKLYQRGIALNNQHSYVGLGHYYSTIVCDYEISCKYYNIAINLI